MKRILLFTLTIGTLIASAQTFVSTTPENKNIILEEYTGISCGYCPDGHAIGQALHDANPNDVFLINIHTGSFATPQGPGTDFNTSFGSALAAQTGLTGYPSGTVNRHIFTGGNTALSRSDWGSSSTQLMTDPSPVNVGVQASVDMATNTLTVDVEVYYTGSQTTVTTNRLNIAVVQNGILGPQSGGSTYNPSAIDPATGLYTHNHMLRHLLTGQWGEEILDINQGTLYTYQDTWTMPTDINGVLLDPTNIAIVAFVAEGQQEILSGTEVYPNLVFANAYDAYLVNANVNDNLCSSLSKGIEVEIKNYGNLPLTTLDIEYNINGGSTQTFYWSGNLASGQATTVVLSNYDYSATATYSNTLNVSVSNPNGNTDQNLANNDVSTTFYNHSFGTMLTGFASGMATVIITTDQYPSEISWEVIDDYGTVVASGGPYASQGTYMDNALLVDGMCYTFNVYDSYGDGILAPGGFEMTDGTGSPITNNYNFTGAEDKTAFKVSGTNPCAGFSTSFPTTTSATCSQSNAYASIIATGGTPPYIYLWSDGQTTATASNLAGGSYSVTATDATGCSITDAVGVGIDNSNSPTSTSVSTNLLCSGDQSGTANVTVVAGTPPYTYLWNNGAVSASITGLSAGSYLLQYTDINGCGGYESITITEPTALSIQIATIDVSSQGGNDGSATATVTGGTPPYTYLWSDGQTTATATGLSAGTYSCDIIDANNCPLNDAATITEPTNIKEINSKILIYPNPAKDILNIDGVYNSITISNIHGQTVLVTNSKKEINISFLQQGIYLITIESNDKTIMRKLTISK